jgi:anthranilate 1,2-dioxygenase large subunit
VQEGVSKSVSAKSVVRLDPGNIGTSESLISEAAIRAMYRHYREVMGL